MEVKIDRHQGANAWLTVGIREGRNREVRRAMNHIGLTVNRLIRISYGPFRLNELKPGEVEEVKPRILRDQLGLAEDDETRPKRAAPKPAGKPTSKPSERMSADSAAKPARKALPPGEGLKQLSETWKKATRPPSRSADDRPAADRAKPSRGTDPRPGPRPKGPRKG
jgi:23S rRNA pseudouridine2605 synthase